MLTALGCLCRRLHLEAAEAVAGASLGSLATLAERSLIRSGSRTRSVARGTTCTSWSVLRADRLAAAGELADTSRSPLRLLPAYRPESGHSDHTPIQPTGTVTRGGAGQLEGTGENWALDRGEAELALHTSSRPGRLLDLLRAAHRQTGGEPGLGAPLIAGAICWTGAGRAKALNRKGQICAWTSTEPRRGAVPDGHGLFRSVDYQVVGEADSLASIAGRAFSGAMSMPRIATTKRPCRWCAP